MECEDITFGPSGQPPDCSASSLSGLEVEDGEFAPSASDIRLLSRVKVEQEHRLKALRARIARLAVNEQRVWQGVAATQQKTLKVQEATQRRRESEAERARMQEDDVVRQQVLRERAYVLRQQVQASKTTPRLRMMEENRRMAEQVRKDRERLSAAADKVRQRLLTEKKVQAEELRQQKRLVKLRKELDQTRLQQSKQETNTSRYASLQEDIQRAELLIEAAAQDEIDALARLQNSQRFGVDASEALAHLREQAAARRAKSAQDGVADEGDESLEGDEPPLERIDEDLRCSA
eukprot:TRINITY_DN42744_c0_g1_i1.p1 TRINITY_DN42744_c0_g1~~TRINITY_DN42744_c0_g1_i1.p1  ORF type:complete len:292 (-),score=93.77 TRINITY_DN42744_c0_g1_i1:223-1098(-)